MRRSVRFGSILAGVVVGLSTTACLTGLPGGEEISSVREELRDLESEETDFLRILNDYRKRNGLEAVKATRLLNQVAYDHALDMGTKRYFDHTNRDGQSPFDRMRAAGYRGGAMSENIAAGSASASATFEQWRVSPGHNQNMLGSQYRAVGIGRAVVPGSPYRVYWTTVFGDVVDPS